MKPIRAARLGVEMFFVLLSITLTAEHTRSQWEPPRNISQTDSNSFGIRDRFITTEPNGYVHVFWREEFCNPFGNCWPRLAYKHSTNDGETWSDTALFRDIPTQVLSIAATTSSNAIHVVYGTYDIGHWIEYRRSTDHGLSWSNPMRVSPAGYHASNPTIASNGTSLHLSWEGWDPSNNAYVFYRRSLNEGLSWGSVLPLGARGQASSLSVDNNTVHLGWFTLDTLLTRIRYRRSTDNGTSWSPIASLSSDTASGYYSLAAAIGHVYTVWIGGSWSQPHGLFFKRSRDGGMNWDPESLIVPLTPPTNSPIPTAIASGSNVHILWVLQDTMSERAVIYNRSTDYGNTWEPPVQISRRSFYTAQGYVSATTLGTTVHAAWGDSAGPLGLSDIFYSRYPFGNVTTIEDDAVLPTAFALHQNYPNPFNPSTKIRFTLPRREFVSLKIYNLIGQEISTLVSENIPIGTHEIEWNPHDLPSGIYFCRLQAGSFTETKKLILIR